jgi:hypothetical protein
MGLCRPGRGSTASDQMARLAGSKRSTRGSLTSVAQHWADQRHFLAHVLGGLAPVDVQLELDDHHRLAFVAARVSALMPAMELTPSSIFLVTSLSTISGEAPGYSAVTTTTGKSMLGNWSTLQPLVGKQAQHHDGQHDHGGKHRVLQADAGEPHDRVISGAWPSGALVSPRAGCPGGRAAPERQRPHLQSRPGSLRWHPPGRFRAGRSAPSGAPPVRPP